MLVVLDGAPEEALCDQLIERLLWPIGVWECVEVAREGGLVGVNALLFSGQNLHREPLGLLAGLPVGQTPRVVEVAARYATEKENVVRLGCERQTKLKDLATVEVSLRQSSHDQMQALTFYALDRNADEAKFDAPEGLVVGVQPHKVFGL